MCSCCILVPWMNHMLLVLSFRITDYSFNDSWRERVVKLIDKYGMIFVHSYMLAHKVFSFPNVSSHMTLYTKFPALPDSLYVVWTVLIMWLNGWTFFLLSKHNISKNARQLKCFWRTLQIWAGSDVSHKLCSEVGVSDQVRLTKEEYSLPGPDVMIYFTSDSDIQKAGFKAIYIITPSTEVNAPEGGMCQLQWRSWQTHWILINMAGTLHKIFLVACNKQVLCMNRYFVKVLFSIFQLKIHQHWGKKRVRTTQDINHYINVPYNL